MLDDVTKKRINTLRQILVGKLPDPKAQVEQITNALIYKFMNDMDEESLSMGGKATYFSGSFEKYSWKNLMDTKTSGVEKLSLYADALNKMSDNENLPTLFRNIFKDSVALLHGKVDKDEKEKILNDFLDKKFKILVSTTIIEVGIDFPNANLIIIENANKFGLSQLHQLRGRVGRGSKQATCILMFKSNLSDNAKKRINILKNSNDGFIIAEEDMKLRGFGDLLGFKQSGVKNFRLADPIHNEDLFILGEKEIKRIEEENENLDKYKPLLKLYDQADIINDII